MCKKQNVPTKVLSRRPAGSICSKCLEVVDSYDRCGCDYQRSPSITARLVAIALLLCLLFSGDHTPTPRTAANWNSHPVAVSWCPGCPEQAS